MLNKIEIAKYKKILSSEVLIPGTAAFLGGIEK